MAISAYSVISKKKFGSRLSVEEIAFFIDSYVSGRISDAQMAAFLMAVRLNGMGEEETLCLTESMAASGNTIDTSSIPNLLDKHSTGGVGDKTSFLIVSMLSATGHVVGMMSGRGLGHTGGTLDKLESIEGFQCNYTADGYLELLENNKAAIISQTDDLAPADKRMYSLRNETATIDSIPLIAASIMSKKIASGTQNLVLDVKYGSGAFMKSYDEAKELAQLMVAIGRGYGMRADYRLSPVEDVLGSAVGNAIEIQECLDIMDGKRDPLVEELRALSVQLAADLVNMVEPDRDRLDVEQRLAATLEDGSAKAAFLRMVAAQGGNVTDGIALPLCSHYVDVFPQRSGIVSFVEVERIGLIAASLGANRIYSEDEIFHDVGIEVLCHLGDTVEEGVPIARIRYGEASKKRLDAIEISTAAEALSQCYAIS